MDESAAELARRSLLDGARSHGPYLWSGRDVSNACRWFKADGQHDRTRAANPAADDGKEEGAADDTDASGPSPDDEYALLRHLISCRGVCEPRPPRPRKRRRLSSASDAAGRRPSPLKSVLLGYYQLADEGTSAEADDTSEMSFAPSDVRNAGAASARLLGDLTSTVAARRRTEAVLDAAVNCLASDSGREEGDGVSVGTGPEIDAYMVRPSTCARRVYASRLYDRLLSQDGGEMPRADGFVDKLMRLAGPSADVRETIFLMLLEPIRRLDGPRGTSRDDGTAERRDPAPLLSSSRVWADRDAIEGACDTACVGPVVTAVAESAASPGLFLGRHEDGVRDKPAGAVMEWWRLPQELLCAVSQAYYPIALGCIRYWIDESILAHDRIFATTRRSGPDVDDVGPTYEDCVRRTRQFYRTSDRLGQLTAHEFHSLRERIMDADVESTGDDEEEGRLHKRLRAWDAVHREACGAGS